MLKSGATMLEHVAVALSMFVGDVVLVGCHRHFKFTAFPIINQVWARLGA
jgi:hypothetical protein